MDQKEILKQLREVMATGDETKARIFLTENFSQLPKDLQRKTATFLLENGLDKVSRQKIKNLDEKVSQFEKLNVIVKEALDGGVKEVLDQEAQTPTPQPSQPEDSKAK
ncbi:MAG: hypothetical protein U9Q72_01505 [Patescibacteria group bacterium]|nr:hypothetical protein [Patescibacteria group bacterium]